MDSSALSRYLDAWAAGQHVAGFSACIEGPSGGIYAYSSGTIDSIGARQPDLDTVYGIGSLSKSLTALCACILADEGKLDLDAPVTQYVPEFSFPAQNGIVTVRHLAMHTSGLPPMEALEWSSAMNTVGRPVTEETKLLRRGAKNAVSTSQELLSCIASCPYPPVGLPGERFSYSNEGYAVLSMVIDRAAGIPLEMFMQQRVFDPLEMKRSILDNGISASRVLSAGNITSLFTWEDGRQCCDDGWTILPPYRGCAMVKSTARDLAFYYRALSCGGVSDGRQALPAGAVNLLLGDMHPALRIPTMCMGIYKRAYAGHIICDHGGALHGVSAKGALLLGEGYGFALLCNESDASLDAAMWAMENAVLGRPLEESHEWFEISQDLYPNPEMLAGVYLANEGLPDELHVRVINDSLSAERNGSPYCLAYCGGERFLALDADGHPAIHLTFQLSDGHPIGVTVGSRIFRIVS